MYTIFAALIHQDSKKKGFDEHVGDTNQGIDELNSKFLL